MRCVEWNSSLTFSAAPHPTLRATFSCENGEKGLTDSAVLPFSPPLAGRRWPAGSDEGQLREWTLTRQPLQHRILNQHHRLRIHNPAALDQRHRIAERHLQHLNIFALARIAAAVGHAVIRRILGRKKR
jgi:hypothetical protein